MRAVSTPHLQNFQPCLTSLARSWCLMRPQLLTHRQASPNGVPGDAAPRKSEQPGERSLP